MTSKWESEKENLIQKILVEKLSYELIGREYGCSGSNIKKVALRLGIELESRRKINDCETFNKGLVKTIQIIKDESGVETQQIKLAKASQICLNCGKEFVGSGKKYCSLKCLKEYLHKKAYELILKGDPSIMKANYNPKSFKNDIINEQNGKCAICGCKEEHNGKPLVFILDHIDGHASHNNRENLRCVCPNCDSQLDTYKSKNKCGERSYYRYHRSASEEIQNVEEG